MFPELKPYKVNDKSKEIYYTKNNVIKQSSITNSKNYEIDNHRECNSKSDISLLKLQYQNLEIKYKHLQSLLKDCQDLVDVQAKEISVLKQLAIKNKNHYNDDLIENTEIDFSFHSPAFSHTSKNNEFIDLQPPTINEIDSCLSPLNSLNKISSDLLQNCNDAKSIDLKRDSPQNSINSKSYNSPKLKAKLPYPFSTHQTQTAIAQFDNDHGVNTFVDGIYKSQSKEFIVETVVENERNVAVLDFDRIIFNKKNPQWINLDKSKPSTNLIDSSSLRSIDAKNINFLNETIESLDISAFEIEKLKADPKSCYEHLCLSRSPSPTKSMLIRERDGLEEELLAQYELMRKMQRGQYNK